MKLTSLLLLLALVFSAAAITEITPLPRDYMLQYSGLRFGPATEKMPEYNVGDTLVLWRWHIGGGPPTQEQVDCTIRGKGEYCYVVVEDSVWNSQMNQTDVNAIVESWENSSSGVDPTCGIYDLNTTYFGPCPDELDGDLRVFLFYYDFDVTADGFFMAFDQYPDGTDPDYRSNEREILYFNSSGSDPGGEYMIAVAAHEFQHLIHWLADDNEDTWVNEGLSELAMFLYGHPDNVSAFNNQPDNDLTQWDANWADYIQTYLWTLYLYEQYALGTPGTGNLIWELVHETANSVSGVNNALDTVGVSDNYVDILPDWVVANYLDLADDSLFGGRYSYLGEDLPNFAPYRSYDSYPVEQSNFSVNPHAGEYIFFNDPGKGYIAEWLHGGFNGDDGTAFTLKVLGINTSDEADTTVVEVTLDGANEGHFDVPTFPTILDRVVMAPVRVAGGGSGLYNFLVDVSETGITDGTLSLRRLEEGVILSWEAFGAAELRLLRRENGIDEELAHLNLERGSWLDATAPDGECQYLIRATATDGTEAVLGPVTVNAAPRTAELALATPYPNPARELVTINYRLPVDESGELVICDLAGRVVWRESLSADSSQTRWNAADMGSGLYLIHLSAGGESTSRRVVIAR